MPETRPTTPERDTLVSAESPHGFVMLQKTILLARNLSRDAKLLYAVLQNYAWQDARCFPGYERLCFDMQASDDSVRKYMRELVAVGLVTQVRRGLGLTNLYTLPLISSARLVFAEYPSASDSARPLENRDQDAPKTRGPNPYEHGHYKDPVDKETEDEDPSIRSVPNAVDFGDAAEIAGYIDDFGREMRDRASVKVSTARAVNLFRDFGGDIEAFRARLYEARRRTQSHAPKRGTRMAYFFAVLESLVREGK
jgi:hypothetical protein